MIILIDIHGKLFGMTREAHDNLQLKTIQSNDLDGNAYNICCLIPSFVDYLYPVGNTDYVKTGKMREFTNFIMFSPDSLAAGLKRSTEVHKDLIKSSVTNKQRKNSIIFS